MRKIVIVAILVLALAALTVGIALANNGPHGGYDIQTSKCAACHRAHTAVGPDLLVEASTYELCISCHGGGSAATNVLLGTGGGGLRLNGGGFTMVGGGAPAQSVHNVEGLGGGDGVGTAWGGASSGTGVQGVLECTSCHNPHGSTNYRILRDSQNGHGTALAHRWVPNNTELLDWQDNQVLATTDDGFNYVAGNTAHYTQGMNSFCATCHKSYLTASGSGGAPSTDATKYFYPGTQDANDLNGDIARYRHAVSRTYNGTPQFALRFAAPGNDPTTTSRNGFACTTCHFAHGSSADYTGYAEGVMPTADSALLYYPNRGVCNSCHQQGK